MIQMHDPLLAEYLPLGFAHLLVPIKLDCLSVSIVVTFNMVKILKLTRLQGFLKSLEQRDIGG